MPSNFLLRMWLCKCEIETSVFSTFKCNVQVLDMKIRTKLTHGMPYSQSSEKEQRHKIASVDQRASVV